ncbi:hypothetical protein J4462_03875 [Candidatus Pacearchaeota archaeon]|nr:hypothetical protein [Candidatus Pacearchaeota archaeon]
MEAARYSPSEIEGVVIEEIRNLKLAGIWNNTEVTRSTALADVGIDSLARAELILLLEREYSLNIDCEVPFGNVGDIINYVDSRLRERYNDR